MPIKAREAVEVPLVSLPTWLFESPEATLSREAVILDPEDPERRQLSLYTYRYWSQRLAAGLQSAGFAVGERVLFLSENSTAWPIVFMGTLMAGGIFSGQSPDLPVTKLTHQASGVQPSFIFASEKGYNAARETAKRIGLIKSRIYLFEDSFLFKNKDPQTVQLSDNRTHWAELLDNTIAFFDWRPYTTSEQLAAINYTSGSTGDSKGVMVSHYNFVANAVQYIQQQKHSPLAPEQNKRQTWVMWTPMYHVTGLTQYCFISPKRGIINYIMSRYDLETYLRYAEQYEANYMFLLPATVVSMLSHPVMKNIDLSRVHTISFGGAPLRESTIQQLRGLLPNNSLDIREAWGMTEMTAVAIFKSPQTSDDIRPHGELLPNIEGKVMTPDGNNELGPDEPGELYLRGPTVAQGYVNLPELSSKTFQSDGWLRTGDLAVYDSKGTWQIKDRIQDIIYHESGSYALPTDLESGLLAISGVNDAGVALIDPEPGHTYRIPRAFVVLDHTKQRDAATVASEFSRRSEAHEQLRGGVFEIDAIPRLPSGKVDRVSLRNRQVSQ